MEPKILSATAGMLSDSASLRRSSEAMNPDRGRLRVPWQSNFLGWKRLWHLMVNGPSSVELMIVCMLVVLCNLVLLANQYYEDGPAGPVVRAPEQTPPTVIVFENNNVHSYRMTNPSSKTTWLAG